MTALPRQVDTMIMRIRPSETHPRQSSAALIRKRPAPLAKFRFKRRLRECPTVPFLHFRSAIVGTLMGTGSGNPCLRSGYLRGPTPVISQPIRFCERQALPAGSIRRTDTAICCASEPYQPVAGAAAGSSGEHVRVRAGRVGPLGQRDSVTLQDRRVDTIERFSGRCPKGTGTGPALDNRRRLCRLLPRCSEARADNVRQTNQ